MKENEATKGSSSPLELTIAAEPNGEATLARRLLFGFGCCCLRWSCRLRLALRLDSLTKAAVMAP
jgi:hypothetical protein